MKHLIIFHINITTFVQSGEGNVQARLHDRKIGYGPDKERVRTRQGKSTDPTFLPV